MISKNHDIYLLVFTHYFFYTKIIFKINYLPKNNLCVTKTNLKVNQNIYILFKNNLASY